MQGPSAGEEWHVDARLAAPPLPPLLLSRARLLTALDRVDPASLTLVAAGPGAGKTVLLSEWVRGGNRRTAWVSVTAADNDPRRFWRLFLAALRAAGVDEVAVPPTASWIESVEVLESLPAGSARWSAPVTMVIDDAHVLTHPEIVRGLDLLVHGWYPQLRLVLAARSDPLLPLHRYRLEGRMVELPAAQMALTSDEVEALLAAHDVRLGTEAFDQLMVRTEGWVTGVRLSAMRMAGTAHPEEFVAELALDQGSIGEYLIAEVLSRQSEPVRQLLIQTSFLDEITGPLADAVTGLPGCAELLAELARGNSFVIPLDPARSRFRCHQLFGEILRYLLRGCGRDAERRLFERAARWYASEGDLQNALTWAGRSGDSELVSQLLIDGGLPSAYVERLDLSTCGLEGVTVSGDGDDVVGVTACAAIGAIRADRSAAVTELRRTLWSDEVADPNAALTRLVAELILAEKAGDTRRIERVVVRALDLLEQPLPPRVRGLRAALLLARARAAFWEGRDADTDAAVEAAVRTADVDGAPAVALGGLGLIALSAVLATRSTRAAASATRAAALRDRLADGTGGAYLSLAEALDSYYRCAFEPMARSLQLALDGPAVEGDECLARFANLLHAQQLMQIGQVVEARTLLLHDLHDAAARGADRLQMWRDLLLATIEVELGRPHTALTMTEAYRGTAFDGPMETARVKAYLALGDRTGTRRVVRRALTGDTRQITRFLLVELTLCDAHLAMVEQETARAVELVLRALDLADGAIALPFARFADVFASLLVRHPSVADRWPVPLRVPSAGPESGGAAEVEGDVVTAAGPPALSDSLTDRERTILRLLATNLTSGEIAEELCVSLNTVKTHIAAVYRKLAARRRREAVARARELELI